MQSFCLLRDSKLLDDKFPHRSANELIRFLNNQSTGWAPVDLPRGYELANRGAVVVGGLKSQPNGHVVVIYPGNMKPRGGYAAIIRGKVTKIPFKGSYPLAASTSIGSWPGAISLGDKTVWDPWGNDEKFADVKFWAPLTSPRRAQ